MIDYLVRLKLKDGPDRLIQANCIHIFGGKIYLFFSDHREPVSFVVNDISDISIDKEFIYD